jgi:hypothetical protein
VTLYKRATAYLSSGRGSAALEDVDSIHKLNPTFSKVWTISLTLSSGC